MYSISMVIVVMFLISAAELARSFCGSVTNCSFAGECIEGVGYYDYICVCDCNVGGPECEGRATCPVYLCR